jgi:hypothetical protein
MNGVKVIDIKEFRERGYLQEANRRFFHPLGLALAIEVDNETGKESLANVWDCRDDPEGIYFAGDYGNDPAKAANIEREWEEKAAVREVKLGWIVQPLGADPPPE